MLDPLERHGNTGNERKASSWTRPKAGLRAELSEWRTSSPAPGTGAYGDVQGFYSLFVRSVSCSLIGSSPSQPCCSRGAGQVEPLRVERWSVGERRPAQAGSPRGSAAEARPCQSGGL